eukprot:scaffold16.g125.t1
MQYATNVSRQQFRLTPTNDGVTVAALGAANPTRVVRAGSQGASLLLRKGEAAHLGEGDRVLLLADNPTVYVALLESPCDGIERPSKRTRSAGPGPAAAAGPQPPQLQHQQAAQPPPPEEQQEQRAAEGVAAAAGAAAVAARAAIGAPRPVCLVLVGLQGAGKSTFAAALAQRSTLTWERINQDSIAGPGRRGTREMCLEATAAALSAGRSAVVDRTNLERDQRRPFVRVAQQLGAEGSNPRVYSAVNAAHTRYQEDGPPEAREGFASVLVCESDTEVAAALETWAAYGPGRLDVAAEYQRRRPPPKPVNTIDRFFKRQQPPGASGSSLKAHGQEEQQEQRPEQQREQQQRGQQQAASPAAEQPASSQPGAGAVAAPDKPAANAFQVLLAAQKAADRTSHAGAAAATTSPAAAPAAAPGGGGAALRHSFGHGAWANALVEIAARPERHKASSPDTLFDDRCVLILDKFPKARRHALVIARDPRLQGPLSLTAADAPLVEHLVRVGQEWVEREKARDAGVAALRFRLGFHAAPSLRQLHMHVVSQDFDSQCLKDKKHWNSFTHPDFFLDADWVLGQLTREGRLSYSHAAKEALLKSELRCHLCGVPQANMPKLKAHIATCSRRA